MGDGLSRRYGGTRTAFTKRDSHCKKTPIPRCFFAKEEGAAQFRSIPPSRESNRKRCCLGKEVGAHRRAEAQTFSCSTGSSKIRQAMALLNQLGFSVLLSAVALVSGYIAFKYARRRKALTREARRKDRENVKTRETFEVPSIATAGVYQGAERLPVESLSALEFQNVALAVTSSPSQQVGAPTAAPLVLHSL